MKEKNMGNKNKANKKKGLKGGFYLFSSPQFYPSVINIDNVGYLSWNNIPIGTLVISTTDNHLGSILRVESKIDGVNDMRYGPAYRLCDVITGKCGEFTPYDFRILVTMNGATVFNTPNHINEIFYGIISGISEDATSLYVMGVNNNSDHLIFNIYNKTDTADIIDNSVKIMMIDDILDADEIINFRDRIINHPNQNQILNLKTSRNGIWALSNILNSLRIPNPIINGAQQNSSFGGPSAAFGGPHSNPPPFNGYPSGSSPFDRPFGGPSGGPSPFDRPFGGPFFGGPTPPPFGGPSFGGPSFGGPSFGGPSFGGPSFGGPSFGGPSFGGPTPPPFGASDGPSFGGPYEQAKSKKSSINQAEEVANIIIKHFYTDAEDLTTANFNAIRENSIIDYSIIKNKLMGNKHFEDKDFKKKFRNAILKLHPDKIDIKELMAIIKNITIKEEIFLEGANIVFNILTELQNPKKVTGGKTSLYKRVYKKEILGKSRVIYKISGSNKEYIKNKGEYVLATEYKKSKKM
jgi:hypothetical protein